MYMMTRSTLRSLPALFALALSLTHSTLPAQQAMAQEAPGASLHGCATDGLLQRLRASDPQQRMREQVMNESIAQRMRSQQGAPRGGMLTIPVVVHIVHDGGAENLSDAQVQAGIDHLNDAFGNSGAYHTDDGVDVGIRFCLAQQDPQGLPTTGITRHQSPLTDVVAEINDADLKNLVRWDPTQYLNIWLVRAISTVAQGSGVAGYAYFPSSHGAPEDGIVNEAELFGSNTNNSKVHVHEAGHYLGLYHTFEGGCANSDCLLNGDRVCDTPPDASVQPVNCGATANSCTTDEDDTSANNPFRAVSLGGLGAQNDLYRDYMDYGLQTCQDLFTAGQADRMYSALENERSSLLQSPGCTSGCGLAILYFEQWDGFESPQTYVLLSPSVEGAAPYTTAWYVDGDLVSTAPTYEPGYLPYGQHVITFQVTNTDLGCVIEQTVTITILCTAPMYIQQSALQIDPGAPITFSTLIPPGVTVQWLLDGAPVGTGSSYTTTFPSAGYHAVSLFADNGSCSDTTASLSFLVGECPSATKTLWMMLPGRKLSFISSPPTYIPVYSDPPYWAGEGVSSIADKRGREIIYTNGTTVWDSTHHLMMNGDSLRGGSSSSQGALIVPDPSENGQYYLFTTDSHAGLYDPPTLGGGLCYNTIDIGLNGGLGAVVEKNVLLHPLTTEKLTAVEHCNGHDVWVASHSYFSDAFHCYLITDDGLNTTPVTSHVGLVHQEVPDDTPGTGAFGCMKFSPQGDKLAVAATRSRFLQLFDFDSRTGVVSNPVTIENGYWRFYSVEFSPDGTKLYATVEGWSWGEPGFIVQYDLSSGDPIAISNSFTLVSLGMQTWATASLQLARDNKIYVTRTTGQWMDVINTPNGAGAACGYQPMLMDIIVNGFGLNNMVVDNRAAERPHADGPTYVCNFSEGVHYTVDCSHPANNQWIYHGPNTVVTDTDSLFVLDFHTAGMDTLIAVKLNGCEPAGYDTLFIQVDLELPLLGADTAVCAPTDLLLDAGDGYASYLWQDGSTASTLAASTIGTYWVTVTALGGCSVTDSIVVSDFPNTLAIDLGPDLTVCWGATDTLYAPPGDFTSYLWSTGSTTNSTVAWSSFAPVPIALTVTDDAGCVATDTLLLTGVYDGPQFSLGPDTMVCPAQVVLLQPQVLLGNAATWLWQDGSTQPTYTVWQPGTYWVRGTSTCGYYWMDTVVVAPCDISTGLPMDALLDDNAFRLQPNPTAHGTTLLAPTGTRITRLTVLDATGRVVLARSSNDVVITTSTWAPGMYLVMADTERGRWMGRLMKE